MTEEISKLLANDCIEVVDPGQPEESYIICIDAKPWRVTYINIIIALDVTIYIWAKCDLTFFLFISSCYNENES